MRGLTCSSRGLLVQCNAEATAGGIIEAMGKSNCSNRTAYFLQVFYYQALHCHIKTFSIHANITWFIYDAVIIV